MNIDKYWVTFWGLWNEPYTQYERKQLSLYTDHIDNIDWNSTILEIWPWNWKFLLMLKDFYWLSDKNIYSIDLSESVVDNISSHELTKNFNNNHWDTIEFLKNKKTIKFDLIVMKHLLEHMTKDYISELIPYLINSLSENWKILIEVPNMANFPLGYAWFFVDFSHMTPFTDTSLKQAFIWNSPVELDFKLINLYIYILDYRSPLLFIKSLLVKVFYYTYCKLLKILYNFANYNFEVTTTAILALVSKKQSNK